MSSLANASAPVYAAQAQDNSSSEQPSKRQKTDREETDGFAAFFRELDVAAAPCWLFPLEEFPPVDTTREGGDSTLDGGNVNSQGSNIGPNGGDPALLDGHSSFLDFLGDGINFDEDVLEGASEPSKDYWNREQQPAPVSANWEEALTNGSGLGIDNNFGTPPSVGPAVQPSAPIPPNNRKRAFEEYWEGPLGNVDGLEELPSQEGQFLLFQQQEPEALAGPRNPPADSLAADPRFNNLGVYKAGGMESRAYQQAHPGSYLANVAPAVPFGGPAAHFAAAAPIAAAPAPAAARPGPAKRGRPPKANAAPRRAVRPADSPAVYSEAGRLIISGLHYTVLEGRVTSLKSSSKKWEGIGPKTEKELTSAVSAINTAERNLKKSRIEATVVGFRDPVSISGQLLDNLAGLVAALGSNEWTDLGVHQQKLASHIAKIQEAIADLREGREVPVVAGPSQAASAPPR
ncbi:hypothetical protein CPLU01_04263 [Colletotrichum plurivorum]|uniref:Uncharacterized protein n=1 Tax=Colletotrichum plurivorum TaxID=2175906 RepID=A0A8H6KQ30_9PEZI|nr:hypothetical protein CPLU01_04263 [Colletotrichum plurivorum]